MSNTMMGIILVVYLIILAILIWVGHKHKKLSTQAINFAGKSYEDVSALVDFLTARNKRDHEVAQLFAGILFDLCHATDKNVLQWKLSMLRNLDFVMNLAGYDNVYDDNFYTWMYNTLTQVPKNVQVAQLQKIRENVKGYYIMDTEVGKNFCDVIADIINMNSNMTDVGETYKKAYKALLAAIRDVDMEFLVADVSKHTKGTPRENLLESMRRLRETCADAEELVKQFDAECDNIEMERSDTEMVGTDGGTPKPDSEEGKIPGKDDPVVQGEEKPSSEETPQPAETKIPGVEMIPSDDGARTGVEVIMGRKHTG